MDTKNQLSILNYWEMAEQLGFVTVEDCIAVRMKANNRNVILQGCVGGKRYHKERVVHNPLAMLVAIGEFKQIRDGMRSEYVKAVLKEEEAKAKAKVKADTLQKQRALIAQKQLEKLQEEERRKASAVYKVRQPIQRILERMKPAANQYTYSNVFGKSVDEVMP